MIPRQKLAGAETGACAHSKPILVTSKATEIPQFRLDGWMLWVADRPGERARR
jgi:hypothetical protein